MFETITASDLSEMDIDTLEFGVIAMDRDAGVTAYNQAEAEISGLSEDRVLGRKFFTEVAPCMNNFMVAQRYEDPGPLDEMLDYVLTLRMAPTPVRLRLLREEDADVQYLLVERS